MEAGVSRIAKPVGWNLGKNRGGSVSGFLMVALAGLTHWKA